MLDQIIIRGARQHNLQNIDLDLPKNEFIVFTGISGSGKSSLAFDTIYAEGQRRYVESLSAYARQFLGLMEKPDVDRIEGLSPAISIDQKASSHNPRSTVGTITEIYDYLRLLFARVGHPHCPNCAREIQSQSLQQIVDQVLDLSQSGQLKSKLFVLAPVIKDRKGEYSALLEGFVRQGYQYVRIDGLVRSLSEELLLIKTNRHTIDLVVDRFVLPKGLQKKRKEAYESIRLRITQSIEQALKFGEGDVIISEVLDASFELPALPKKLRDHLYSEKFACPFCNISLSQIEPRTFSFNSPHGACRTCSGLGTRFEINSTRVINGRLSIREGGILPWSRVGENGWLSAVLAAVSKKHGFDLDTPLDQLSDQIRQKILYGTGSDVYNVRYTNKYGHSRSYETSFEGIIPNLKRRYQQTESDYVRAEIEKYMIEIECESCHGTRLRPEALNVIIKQKNIAQIAQLSIQELKDWVDSLRSKTALSPRESAIAKAVLKELASRIKFLLDVGLEYLSIDRSTGSLSGGEAQRIRLASQIGSGLTGILYVLDEPSVGLHARDQGRLIRTLKELRDLGNTVIVCEHDLLTIGAADFLVDIGPGAGEHGGKIVFTGTPAKIRKSRSSLTGAYLAGRKKVRNPCQSLRPINEKKLIVVGAAEHNLKKITVKVPLQNFVCVTGVSGSGKSTLVVDILYRALAFKLYNSREIPGQHSHIEGIEQIDKVVNVDQSPIGRTPRSNPATYTGIFTYIREIFASTPEARARGYQKGRFSFNVRGGRCENCQGDGQIRIEMQFLPDVYVDCEVCQGKRFNRETLEVDYKEKSIADVLEMTVEEALAFFKAYPGLRAKLQTLCDVGLGYIKLGQPAPTLSGGEAQRVKLSAELSKRSTGKTVYILDEPTTGLHQYDVEKLLTVLHRLVEQGNTVIVIEHNLDVIKTADYIIDLGPEGGEQGGYLVANGSVDELTHNKHSYTGRYLAEWLNNKV